MREEILTRIKETVVNSLQEIIDDIGEDDDDYTEYVNFVGTVNDATNLSQIAEVCQRAAWDLAAFVSTILMAAEFLPEDMDYKWLNEHGYGWDT